MMPPAELNNPSSALSSTENPSRALQPRPLSIQPVAVAHTPPALSSAPNALSLLKALRRRLGPALLFGLMLAAIVAPVVWFLLPPPKLTARMKLHVARSEPKIMFEDKTGEGNPNVFIRSQADLIHDRFTILKALGDTRYPQFTIANLSMIQEQNDPAQWLEERIAVEFPSPEYMNITLSGDRGEELKKIVGAVTKAYLDNYVDKAKNARESRRTEIVEGRKKFEKRMDTLKLQLREKQQVAQALDADGANLVQEFARQQLHLVERRIAEIREKLIVLSAETGIPRDWEDKARPVADDLLRLQSVMQVQSAPQSMPGSSVPFALAILVSNADLFAGSNGISINEAELEAEIEKDDEIKEATKMLQNTKKILAQMHARLQKRVFEQKAAPLFKQEKGLEDEIEHKKQALRKRWIEEHRNHPQRAPQGGRIEKVTSRRTLKLLEAELITEAEKLRKQCEKHIGQAADLNQWIDEIDGVKRVLNKAAEQINAMEVEQEAPSRITKIYDEPILVTPNTTQRNLMITGGSALAALVIVMLAFSWFEFQSRKLYTPDEVVHQLGFQLVGTVPDHSPRGWLPWSRSSESNSAYTQSMLTESVDTARTMLLHVARQEKIQIVMIASALSGEGKTSLASHLAASLARAGRRTILVDSDLRNPTLHRLFERERAPGLSELLRGEVDLAGIIGEVADIPNLWLIPGGRADAVALQTLAFDVVPKLFERLRLHYDFIIVDSCPVLPVTDAILVGQHVDAVIFSLLREVSRMPRVYAAYQRLANLGIRMLGAVVNGTQHERYPSDYHYVVEETD